MSKKHKRSHKSLGLHPKKNRKAGKHVRLGGWLCNLWESGKPPGSSDRVQCGMLLALWPCVAPAASFFFLSISKIMIRFAWR